MTPQIKSLIAKRQAAFNKKHTLLWRQLRNKVIKAICIAKETTYANWVRNLKKTSPGEWYKHIRVMSGQTSGTNNIFVPDVDPPNNKAVADAICCQFATVGGNIFPLDRASLPSYLPAQKPLRVQPYEVFSQLSHLKQRNPADQMGFQRGSSNCSHKSCHRHSAISSTHHSVTRNYQRNGNKPMLLLFLNCHLPHMTTYAPSD